MEKNENSEKTFRKKAVKLMSEIEGDSNLRAGALSSGVKTVDDPMKSGPADQGFNRIVCCRAMVQANERYGALA